MTEKEARELLQQAMDLYQQGELDKAIDILRKIRRKDSPKQYAKAQFILGLASRKKGDSEGEIAAYRNITREDFPEWYAKAQFNLGVRLSALGNTEGAIAAWSNITSKDSTEQYAKAQFNLGNMLIKQKNIEGAIDAWSNITRKDSTEQYAKAQFNLGVVLLEEKKDIERAIDTWRNITPEDSTEQYAKAQFNLGVVLLEEKKDIEGAIIAWDKNNITRKYSPNLYAKAQFNLGAVLLDKKKDIEGAINAWDENNIKREDASEPYARAQLNLGILLEGKNDIKGALDAYNNIIRDDCPYYYAKSRLNLGFILGKDGKTEKEVATYQEIRREDLGDAYEENYYEIESALKPLDYREFTTPLLEIRRIVATLIRNLLVQKDNQDSKKPKVAHYTDPNAAYNIIAKDSPLHLTSVQGVNDPSEGLVLYQYIQNHYEQRNNTRTLALSADAPNQATSVFLSCFTFNHDSLNQFRLYGKEKGREASGISLVIDQNFFSNENLFGIMAASVNTSTENHLTELDDKDLALDKQDKLNSQPKNKLLEKLPLYRCLYIDPRSGYLSIAQRDKATFFAEAWHDNKTADYKTICEQAEKDWCSYRRKISKLTSVIKDEFTQLAEAVAEILNKSPGNDVLDTLAFILQPLRYLVKHAAFQEEQECRMLYITSLDDVRIKSEWDNKRMYLEYATPVKEVLDKIYLSPGAQPHEDFFKKELLELAKAGKIRHSRNPFRNK